MAKTPGRKIGNPNPGAGPTWRLGLMFRAYRRQANLSLKDAALEIGTSDKTLNSFERGQPISKPEIKAKILDWMFQDV